MDSFDKGWFVLQTYSGYENKVKENLLQRAQTYNMLENILRVEIPTQTVQVEKNGKSKEVEENRFPGYVLVEMVMTDEAWFVVRNTPNVTGFVGSHGNRSKPTPLLEEEIRSILISMGQTVQEFKKGKVAFKVDKLGSIHLPIGKVDFTKEAIVENFKVALDQIIKLKPAASKGQYLRTVAISLTMGPGIKIDPLLAGAFVAE